MSATRGVLVVAADTVINGLVRNGQTVEIFGYIEGDVSAQNVIIRDGGRLHGRLRAETAEIHGRMQGQTFVKHVMRIGPTGSVNGKVQYGQLAMEIGAVLSAEVRNVPPAIFGDLEVAVERGGVVVITTADLTAVDPDETTAGLQYAVLAPNKGFIELASAPGQPAASFTQADLEANLVSFRHDGSQGRSAGFSVVVADRSGGTSGAPTTVHVAVR